MLWVLILISFNGYTWIGGIDFKTNDKCVDAGFVWWERFSENYSVPRGEVHFMCRSVYVPGEKPVYEQMSPEEFGKAASKVY
jgi:hypothetical protein